MSSAAGTGSEGARVVAEFCAQRYATCGAAEIGFDLQGFTTAVSAVVERWNASAGEAEARTFLASLHLEELILTRGCAAGNEHAWERFLTKYRATLYSAAYKIARDEASARELADSLYAELYGISGSGGVRTSKLLYYSGRGSLEGWLRTVVAQEWVNRHRRTRRETSLDEAVEDGKQFAAADSPQVSQADGRLNQAVTAEMAALDAEDRFLLASYYLDGRKLAEIAQLLRVHESTISRKLEKATASLRKRIRKRLIDNGISPREAEEWMQEVDVRDLQAPVEKSLRQENQGPSFSKGRDL